MSDLVRQNSRKPPTLMTQSSETRSEQDVSSTGGADSPGRRRRASLDRPGLATRRSKAPDAETNALLRDRFLHHLVTQVKLSSVTPFLLLARSADTATLSGRLNAMAAATCGLVVVAALIFKARAHVPAWAQVGHDAGIVAMKRLDYLCLVNLSLATLGNVVLRPSLNGMDGTLPSERVLAYFATAHLAIGSKWVVSQVPARIMLIPELLRNAATVGVAMVYVRVLEPDGLTPAFCAALLLRGLGATMLIPCMVNMCHNPLFKEQHLPARMQLCPLMLRPLLEFVMSILNVIKARLAPEPLIGFLPLLSIHASALALSVHFGIRGGVRIAESILLCIAAFISVHVVARLHSSNASSLRMLEQRLGVSTSFARTGFGSQLSGAVSEHDVLRVASEALHMLFPTATSTALGTMTDGNPGQVSILEVAAVSETERVGLLGAMPRTLPLIPMENEDGDPLPGLVLTEGPNSDTSVAFVCGHAADRGAVIADSTDWPEGVHAFQDWAVAEANGCSGGQFVTGRLVSHGVTIGFVMLHFRGTRSFSTGNSAAPEALREFCDAVGEAVLARRAKDSIELMLRQTKDKEAQALSLSTIARDIYPQHLLSQLEARARRREVSQSGGSSRLLPRMTTTTDGGRSSAGAVDDFATDLLSDSYPDVTVVFADIVGWTSLASNMTAEASMHLLDRLFQRFDTLATAHGVYKVETIGDSYLCVSGMLPERADHACAALRLGLDMHAAAASVEIGDGRCVQVRVGMHSGEVTSGIIGHVRARFCLFGDTVNTASRMESTGRAGCVQMSAASYQATGLPLGAVPQRRVDVKGKGLMETFVLDAASPEAAEVRALLDSGTLNHPPIAASVAAGAAATDAAPNDAANELDDDYVVEADDMAGEDDGTAGMPVLVSRTSTSAAAIGRDLPHKAATRSPPSTMGSSAATQDQDAAVRMREAAISHFIAHLFFAVAPGLVYITMSETDALLTRLARALFGVFMCVVGVFSARNVLPLALRQALAPWWTRIGLLFLVLQVLGCEVSLLLDFLRLAGPACPDSRRSSCTRVFFWHIHAPLASLGWLMAQLPVTRVFFPELVRGMLYVAFALHFAYQDGMLSLWYAVSVAAEGLGCAVVTPVVFLLCYRAPDSVLAVLTDLETCPRLFRGYRSYCYSFGLSLRRRFFGDEVLLDSRTNVMMAAFCVITIYRLYLSPAPIPLLDGVAAFTQFNIVMMFANVMSKLKVGAVYDLDALADEVKTAERAQAMSLLRDRLAVAPSEAAILRAGCEAISDLFPGGVAYAMAAFAESSACSVVTVMHLMGEPSAQEALLSGLPSHVGAQTLAPDGLLTSVARACHEAYGRPSVLDSRELPGGLSACADWAAAVKAGLNSVHAATAPLNAGHVTVGFMQMHFGARSRQTVISNARVREVCDAVGGAIFVRRAFAINRDAFASGMRAAGVPSTPTAQELDSEHPEKPYPANEADAKALAELDERAVADKATLESWALDPWTLEVEEVQRLCCAMLHTHGLLRRFRISPSALKTFVSDVSLHYNDNAFHNFRHAFMVAQICYLFLSDSTIRRKQLLEIDMLALLLAALCHDLEHPGTTNAYQVNSGSALALRYNDSSVLENHHCSCCFVLLDRSGILKQLEANEVKVLRRLIVAAVLATDMAVHKDLVARVSAQANDSGAVTGVEASAGFSRELPEHRELLVSFLLHCADLCCPLAPPPVSRRIAESLSVEFARQAERERAEGLPVTVPVAKDENAKAKMELGFIDFVVRPLYLTLAIVAPGLGPRCLSLIECNRSAWAEIITVSDSETASSRRSG